MALVPAQDASGIRRPWQGGQSMGSAALLSPPVHNQWRAPSGEIQLVTANEDQPSGGLRSVLTRRSTLADSSRQQAESPPSGLESPPALLEQPDMGGPGNAELSMELAPGPDFTAAESDVLAESAPLFETPAKEAPAATLEPPAAWSESVPLASEPSAGEDSPSSSRRTFQNPPAGSAPPSMAPKPVTPTRTSVPERPASGTLPAGTLNSSTGAFLRVDTVGPEAVIIGEATELSIRLSNLGVIEAQRASVRISIPQNLEVISSEVEDGSAHIQQESVSGSVLVWTIDRVAARAERRMTLRVIPRTAAPLELPIEWSVAPISTVARIQVQQPRLELAVQGPGELVFGDTKVFTVTVSNPGSGEARQVSLRLSLGDDSTDDLQVGTIAAGASRKYEVEVTARQAGPMAILAVVQGANELRAETRQEIRVRRAELKLEVAGSGMQFAGSVGTYQVRVANHGDAPADNLQASVRLPSSAEYLRGLENAQQQGNELSWPVGRLDAGEERTYRFFCQLNQAGDARFNIAVRNDGGLHTSSSLVTRVEAIADLKMTVNDPPSPVPVGKPVLYEIQIVNRGTKAAKQVQVIAQFSDGIEPVAVEGSPAELVPGQTVFEPIAQVNPGETVILKVKAKAERDGNHVFRAELRCGDPEYRLIAEDTTTFYRADLLDASVESGTVSPSDAGSASRTSRREPPSVGR